MLTNTNYELIFIAEDTTTDRDFTNFGYVFSHYVFGMDADEKSKAAQFSWLDPRNIKLLIQSLFKDSQDVELQNHLISHKGRAQVFDLTDLRSNVVSAKEAESIYPEWIKQSNRHDNFDEFCAFMGLADYINRHQAKNNLILCLFEEAAVEEE